MSGNSSSPERALAARLPSLARDLVPRSLEHMARDAFWRERYGDRGMRFANADGQFHLTYLVDALTAGTPATVEYYARWLRSVLVSRGMCTRHLAEHFAHLAAAIGELPGGQPGADYLQTGIEGLRYAGATRELVDRAESVSAWTGERPSDFHSGWDPLFLTHYLADAITAADAPVFEQHVSWLLGRGGDPGRTRLRRLLADVRRELGPLAEQEPVQTLLGAAQRLAETGPGAGA